MAKPLVAIVGRPNVGKSMLFNKLTGRRTAIVEDTPGVTRDRIYGDCDWNGREFELVDTGGIEPKTNSEMLRFMRRQAEIAIETADVIVMVCDIKTGPTAADSEIATMLQRSKKPVILAVNKCDNTGPVNPDVYEFYSLGLGDPIPVSAFHGHGTGDLLDLCVENFPPPVEEDEDEDVIRVAIVGKPNVGKSSLLNFILGEERVIVSDVAGTTRDAIDSYYENEYGKYIFIDTAGMRKKARVDDSVEKFSNMRTVDAISRADVCLIMIDAGEGVTEQDTKIAGLVHEAGKQVGCGQQGYQDHGQLHQVRPGGHLLHDLCSGAVYLGADGAAGGPDLRDHQRSGQPECHADLHRNPQQHPGRRHRPGPAPHGQGPASEGVLYHAVRGEAAHVRTVLQQCQAVPLLLSAVSGEPASGGVRL